MQSLRHHAKRPGIGLVQQTPAIINLILRGIIHCIHLPLHQSTDVQEAELSLADHKAEPTREPEVLVYKFNTESLKVDILDEKFSITTFIAGLGVQSKDLMFSILKNPQASIAKVLAKAEKYINDEEALLSKMENSSAQKEKSRGEKKLGRSPRRRGNRDRSPRRDRENRKWSLKRKGNFRDSLGPPQPELQQQQPP